MPSQNVALEEATRGRLDGYPSYLPLASINFDHFGQDARTAYTVGHALALQAAANKDLEFAYILNAFADHFLEDSFSAGHLRTPRRGLHDPSNPASDLCSKYMHDEDNALGLDVKTLDGANSWTAVGDAYLRDDPAGIYTLSMTSWALRASASEIWSAYQTGSHPTVGDYYALQKICPSIESATGRQKCAPLFWPFNANMRRKDISNRTSLEYTDDWWYATTVLLCEESGKWDFPLTLN